MAKTKQLALTTTPQQIVPLSNCTRITIKEDESVTDWPTVALVIRKPSASDEPNLITAGRSYAYDLGIDKPGREGFALPLWVSVASGTTTGIQDEEP